jgi:hypothetical protein
MTFLECPPGRANLIKGSHLGVYEQEKTQRNPAHSASNGFVARRAALEYFPPSLIDATNF